MLQGAERSNRHSGRALASLFVTVFAAHALFFVSMRSVYPEWEPAAIPRNGWFTIAQNVAAGNGYVLPALLTYFPTNRLVPTAARGPVPVYFLAAFVTIFPDPYYPLLIAAWLLSAGNSLLAYAIVRRVTGRPRLALVTAILVGLHLSEMYINTAFSYASEPVFMHLLGWTVLCATIAMERRSWRYAAAAGLCLGAACLARSTVVLLPVLLAAAFVVAHRAAGVRMALAAGCVFGLMQLPWVLRNRAVFDRPVLTTTLSGYGVYMSGIAARDERVRLTGWDIDRDDAWREMRSTLAATGRSVDQVNEPEFDDVLSTAGRRLISAHRTAFLKNVALSALGIWYWQNSGRGLYLVQNAVYDLLALVGLCVAVARRQRALLALLLLPAYGTLVHLPFLPQFRYILPFTPFLFAFSALGLLWLFEQLRGQRSRPGPPRGERATHASPVAQNIV